MKLPEISLTEKELEAFYLEAFNRGRNAKNVCGSLSTLYPDSWQIKSMVYQALALAVNHTQELQGE